MSRVWLGAAALALTSAGCVASMVRAPKQIPSSGVVECTDSTSAPEAALLAALVSGAVVAYGLSDPELAIKSGGAFWIPVLGVFGIQALFASAEGYVFARECRTAKRQGAELARSGEARAKARDHAVTEWKRAAVAARAGDCATVRELDGQIRALDAEFHSVMFQRDIAIVRCLTHAE